MDSVALWIESEDENGEVVERIELRRIRDNSNVLALNEKSFTQNFRLSKGAFVYVLDAITPELKTYRRSTAIPPIIKLSAAFKLLGQGGYQHQIGQDHNIGLSQQSMSRCLMEVCKAMEKILCPRHIKFQMSEDEEKEAKRFFFRKCGIPGVIGAVDGTHVQMITPAQNEHLYLNRKLKHSMNAMVICDHMMRIRSVDSRYGGTSHDSHVWKLSNERKNLIQRFENGERKTWILGDAGCPLEPWILTPYRNSTENSAECRFNDNHAKGRSIIERVFGVLKGRFRCLLAARELHYGPQKVGLIMNVCCALHNICLQYNVELATSEIADANESEGFLNLGMTEDVGSVGNLAKKIRDEIKNSLGY